MSGLRFLFGKLKTQILSNRDRRTVNFKSVGKQLSDPHRIKKKALANFTWDSLSNFAPFQRGPEKVIWKSYRFWMWHSLFVPNPNTSTHTDTTWWFKQHKICRKKRRKDILPRRAGRGGSVRILMNPKILPPMTAKK